MDGAGAVEVRQLSHRYGKRTALDSVNLSIAPGEIFALLGPNGGGKSTLFRILATLLTPSAGEARVLGFDVCRQPAEVRRRIGVLFQSPSLDRKLSIAENLRHHGHLYGLHGGALTRRIDELLGTMQLTERRRERVERLSGGLLRRVEIAKALVPAPALLLLDEPGSGLDPAARRRVRDLLERVRASGVTCVLTTHHMDDADTCDRVAILDRGRIIACDSPRGLKASIHGDVVTLVAERPADLRDELKSRFGLDARGFGDALRIEAERGHELAARLAETFGERISSATVTRPTLDDAFFKHTGHRLDGAEPNAL